ncbi:MAG: hypothetical protein KA297_13910 [Kofleriaceae bacterium]|nr:hypothetical protein [Kofleriaceae bacterium]MBP6841618.1 hypothetical protein [Kofleriaceae bacterium]
MRPGLAVLVLVLAALAGCKKGADKTGTGAAPPPPIGEAERARGATSCKAYVEALCACATTRPDDAALAESCRLDKALPEAMTLSLQASLAEGTGAQEVQMAQQQFRKIVNRCLEEAGRLPSRGCPSP